MNNYDKAKTKFIYSFRHKNSEWSFELFAEDFEDAARKLQSLKSNAVLDGELIARIPIAPKSSLKIISKLFGWIKLWSKS